MGGGRTASAQKMAGETHPGKSRLLNTPARALCVQGRRGLLSKEPSKPGCANPPASTQGHSGRAASGGVLPSRPCLPQPVPATATGCHSLLLLGMDGNEGRSCRRGKTAKAATVPSSWAPT